MMQSQKWQEKRISWATLVRLFLIIVAFVLVIAALALALLTRGSWSVILSAILASFAVVAGFIPMLVPTLPSDSIPPSNQAYDALLKEVKAEIITNQGEGALIIYTIPEMRGKTIEILDLQTQAPVATTTVSQYTIENYSIYVAVVHLRPGYYIVQSPTATPITSARTIVTIETKKVYSVIWRKKYV